MALKSSPAPNVAEPTAVESAKPIDSTLTLLVFVAVIFKPNLKTHESSEMFTDDKSRYERSPPDVNVPDNNFTKEQWLTLKNLLNDLIEQFPGVVIKGHNEVSSKACPSFDVQAWLLKEGIIKTKQVTTPEEKQYLEEKREQFRGEQLELFGGRKDK